MNTTPIYTIENDCKDCYKCIRNCPSKAIKITEQKASIIDELCIYCGRCVSICPAQAKQVRNDVSTVKQIISSGSLTAASVAPTFRAEYGHLTDKEFNNQLLNLGFNYISETALGAQTVSEHTQQFLNARKSGVFISSACPGVVELIKKYYPNLIINIIPFLSPMQAHAKKLKSKLGNNVKVVFIGPCIAKKTESDTNPNLVDAAITYKELNSWIKEHNSENITTQKFKNTDFYPYKASQGNIYPIEGGMIKTLTDNSEKNNKVLKISFSGIAQVKNVLNHIQNIKHTGPVFLELLLCEGGCINGSGCEGDINTAQRKIDILFSYKEEESKADKKKQNETLINIECDYFGGKKIDLPDYSPEIIQEALSKIGKTDPKDELNCGSCGYNTCREFAIATLNGMAESNMCILHLKKLAHNQASVLLKKIPSGVIIIDHNLTIKEINKSCIKMLGNDISYLDLQEHFIGKHIDELGFFTEYFKTAIHTGKEYNQIPIIENHINFQLSIFNIQKHKLVAGIIQDFQNKEFKGDIIEKRTREVIRKNMETVQKIAALLGENASYTDSLLNSILSDHSYLNQEIKTIE